MNARHTPGPWIYAPSRDDKGELARVTVVAHCCGYVIGLPTSIPGGNYRDGDPSGDEEADARLIAAAPDLLEACQTVLAGFDRGIAVDANTVNGLVAARLRSAVAKAEGRS
ncbi:MAG TPA: hypothetical protein PKC95_00295 [Thauera aminoaromatica]|nr:hypothetical protein [Thauera aminoaromatica]